MELAGLLNKFKSTKDEPKKFLALEITDEIVQAAVWHVVEGRTELVTTGSPVEWGGDSGEVSTLLSASDATISQAVEGLTTEPTETIFGVTTSWIKDDKLEPAKLTIIKQICDEFELKALGFVDILDSVIRQLKVEEGVPPTALLIQVYKKNLTINLVTQGKVLASVTTTRTTDATTDVEGALAKLSSDEFLPSRLLIFDGMQDLSSLVQQLVAHNWSTRFKFLHIPQVNALPRGIAVRSVAEAGGAEVAKAIGFAVTNPPQAESPSSASPAPVEVELAKPESLGFSATPQAQAPAPSLSATKRRQFHLPPLKLPHFSFTRPHFPRPSRLLLPLIAFVLLLALLLGAVWYLPHSTIAISVTPMPLLESLTLTLDPSLKEADIEAHRIPGELIEHSVTGEESAPSTGHKLVGDSASGSVTLYNRTALTKNFTKGTVLSSGNLKFTLDSDVIVASKTAGVDYVDVPGKATVKVVASSIGSDSNLPSGSEFAVSSFSKETYIAKNDSPLTGGTSKEAQVVTKADQASLLQSLQAKLLSQASKELRAESGQGTGIYPLESSAKLVDTIYSSDVGEEADEFKVSTSLTVSAIKYQVQDVEKLVSDLVDKSIPSGYMRLSEPPLVELSQTGETTADNLEVTAKVTINLIPIQDSAELAGRLRGASLDEVPSLLSTVPGYKDFSVSFVPHLLKRYFHHLPRNPDNIRLVIEPSL